MKQALLLLLLLLAGWGARAQTLLQQQSFEGTGTDALAANAYTATTVANNSTNIYFFRTTLAGATGFLSSSTVTNITGSYFWASENVRRDANNIVRGNPAANVTLTPVSVAGKANLFVRVALADAAGSPNGTQGRWETDDYVRVQYRFNGTGIWNTIGQFVGDGSGGGGPPPSGYLRQDTDLDGTANAGAPVLTQALTDYSFTISGSGSTLEVRVEIDQDGASEEFGFDNIRVYGSAAASAAPVLGSIETTALAYAEGAAATAITNTLTVSDADNTTLTSATITITNNFESAEDVLAFVGDGTTGNITAAAFNTTTGRLTLTSAGSTATLAQWQNALRKVSYRDTDAADASPKTRTVSLAVTDPTGVISTDVTRDIAVSVALDAASTVPYTEPFETDGEGTRYSSNHFYNQDEIQFQRATVNPVPGSPATTFSNLVGSGYWFGVNTNSFANPSAVDNGVLTTKQVNAAGFTNLHFQIRVGASVPNGLNNGTGASWLSTYYFQIFYRVAGSNTWTAFGLFRGTGAAYNNYGVIRQDSNPNGTGTPTGPQLTTALQNFDFALPAALNGQTVDFQLVLLNGDSSNDFAFDQIQVTGTPPTTVASIVPAATNPTNAGNVTYTVTFASSVTGVTASNFATAPSAGITGSSVTSVSGAGTTYTVTVNTGSGSGTLGLTLANDTGISPGISNAPFTGTPLYTIDKTAPTVAITSGTAASGGSTTTTPLAFTVTFSKSVTGFVAGDVTVTNGSITGAVSGAGTTYTFSVTPTTAGTATTVTVPAAVAQDGVGNFNTASNTYSITYTPPALVLTPTTLLGGTAGAAYSQTITASGGTAPYTFAVMSGALPAGLTLTTGGLLAGTPTAGGSFSFTIRATDAAALTGSRAYTLLINAALTVTVSSTTGASGSTTTTSPIPFSVSFSQSVGTTFVASDVTVTGGTLTSGSFTGSGSGPYSFTATPSGPGTVAVSVAAGVANDANNTPNTASNTYSLIYQLSATAAPVLNTPANNSTVGGSPAFSGTAPAGSTVTVYVSGAASQTLTTTATGGTFTVTPATALASGSYAAYATAQASGSNVSSNSNTNTFTVDAAAPTVLSINRQSPAANPTNATTLTYRITFSEAVTGVDATDFSLAGTGTASGSTTAVAAVSTSVFDVTVSGTTGNGTLRLDLKSTGTGIADLAGNTIGGGYTSGQSYTLDTTAPTAAITSSAGASGSTTSTTPIPFTVTFSEAVTGFSAAGLTVANGTVGTVSGSGPYTFSVTPTTAGIATTVTIAANAAQDAAGNGNPVSSTYTLTYVVPVTATSWTGTISTDWFTAGNWTNGVPTATIDAAIPTGTVFSPAIASGAATTRSLTLNGGARLTMSGGTLDVRANFTNNGTFVPTGGTVVLGTTAQSNGPNILGSGRVRFWNLIVNSNGVLLSTSAGASVRRLLTLNGALVTQSNSFVLESDASGTALVVNSNLAGFVFGTATVQRAIDPSANPGIGYRHYSSPVSNSTVADLATATFAPIVNPAYNTAAAPTAVTPFPTVYGYNDSRLSLSNNLGSFDKGYVSPAALSDPLAVGRGYTVNIGASEIVDFQGPLNNGDLTLNLTSTRPTYPEGGWQLLGNPYPAPLNYALVDPADRAGLEDAIYVYSSASQYNGQYRSYVNGVGNAIIPLGQAFFARVASGLSAASLTFRNRQRLTEPDGTTFQRSAADLRPLVQLTLQAPGSALADEATVYFENGATAGFEPAYDAVKLPNPTGLNLSTSTTGQQLAINGQAVLDSAPRVVPLAVGVPAAGSYTFMATRLLNLSAVPVYLRDLQSGAVVDLRQNPSYQFTVSNAAALLTGRFELVFSPQQPLATVPAALAQQVALYPNPAKTQVAIELPPSLSRQPVTATLLDALGRVVRQQVLPAGLATHTLPLATMASGVYSLRLTTELGTLVKKLVIE